MNFGQFLVSLGMKPEPLSSDDDDTGLTAPNVITPPRTIGVVKSHIERGDLIKRGASE